MKPLPTQAENPDGLHARYAVTYADGRPVDPNARYFVLRLDPEAPDAQHAVACRIAARAYVAAAPAHMAKVAEELERELDQFDLNGKQHPTDPIAFMDKLALRDGLMFKAARVAWALQKFIDEKQGGDMMPVANVHACYDSVSICVGEITVWNSDEDGYEPTAEKCLEFYENYLKTLLTPFSDDTELVDELEDEDLSCPDCPPDGCGT